MTDERFKVINGSQSAHCCFDFTVVDTTDAVIVAGKQWLDRDGEPQWRAVCECFEEEDAVRITRALNAFPPA
jgi:hypothetical protein